MSWLHLRQLQTNLKEVFVLLFWRNSTWMHQTGHWITKLSIFTSKEEVKTLEWILRLNWSLTGNVALFIWRKNWKQQEKEKKRKKTGTGIPLSHFLFPSLSVFGHYIAVHTTTTNSPLPTTQWEKSKIICLIFTLYVHFCVSFSFTN